MLDEPSFNIGGNRITPNYLAERDYLWLRRLLEEHERYVGREFRQLKQRYAELEPDAPVAAKHNAAVSVLLQRTRRRSPAAPKPAVLRAAVFTRAAKRPVEKSLVLAQAAQALGVEVEGIERDLFADLPEEKKIEPLVPKLEPHELARWTNLTIVSRLLFSATKIRLELQGNVHSIVKSAKTRGLIVEVRPRSDQRGLILAISGPYALFRKTRVYGHALAKLLPELARAKRFELEADCVVNGRKSVFRLETGAPIFPARENDDDLETTEAKLERGLVRALPDWEILRDPPPFDVGGDLVFMDFQLRAGPDAPPVFLEILGFWTADYLAKKSAALRAAGIERAYLCADEKMSADGSEPSACEGVLFFKGPPSARAIAQRLGERG